MTNLFEFHLPTHLLISSYFVVPTALVSLFVAYYLKHVVKKPELHCANSHFANFIKANCPVIEEHYWPSVWCFYSHSLTSFSNLFRHLLPKLSFRRECIITPDGGEISLDWYEPKDNEFQTTYARPISLILPGLTGHSHAEYLRILIPQTFEAGLRPVVLNYRGLGGNALKTPRLYCAANHDDLEFALQQIRQSNPDVTILATGLSLGGSILASYLTTAGSESLVDAACLISVCWDFHKGATQLKSGYINPKVNLLLAKLMQNVVQQHRKLLENSFDLKEAAKAQTLGSFDEIVTRRMFGYGSVHEYYSAATQADRLALIKVPTLCINAGDDMLAPTADLPLQEI